MFLFIFITIPGLAKLKTFKLFGNGTAPRDHMQLESYSGWPRPALCFTLRDPLSFVFNL